MKTLASDSDDIATWQVFVVVGVIWRWWLGFVPRKRRPSLKFTEEEVAAIMRAQEFKIELADRLTRGWTFEKQNHQQRTLRGTMKKFSPSIRSLSKLIRDGLVIAAGSLAVYLGSNAADAGVSAPVAAAIGPVALFAYRWLREAAGLGPDPAV